MHVSLAVPWIECIPNVSEGQNSEAVLALSNFLHQRDNVRLLHVDAGASANRSVFTFLVRPGALVEVGLEFIQLAHSHIDMRQQVGAHPRVGAVDVFPTVALGDFTEEQLIELTNEFAKSVGESLNHPIYLYEKSQPEAHRKRLEQIRRGGYEGLVEKLQKSGWKPDFGPATFNPKHGVTVMGVRDILVAINFSLASKDLRVAQSIARAIRTSGYKGQAGLLQHVKAIGWSMPEYECVQVSTNLTNYKATSVFEVFATINHLAKEHGTLIKETELIGLIPKNALEVQGYSLESAIQALKLSPERNGNMVARILDLDMI